jgi:ABC-type dipeptide/oligopeptide/nickel transport system permease subunit
MTAQERAVPAIDDTTRSTAPATAESPLAGVAKRGSGPSLFRRLFGSAKGMTGAFLVGLAVFAAVFAPIISPHSPSEQMVSGKFAKPWFQDRETPYLLGGDNLGRDILSRTIYGSRASLALGISVTVIAAIVGSILGMIAGFQRGVLDTLIMRLVDFQLSIPFIILALIFLAILGPGFKSVFVALSVALWVNYARLVRAETLKIRETEYVVAANTIGASPMRVLGVHILPNILHSIIVLATLDMAFVIVFESSLTFLGLGIQPPTPTWGFMLSEGHNYLRQSPWMSIVPGAAIVMTVVGINLLGDWLRDTLDPSLRGR